MSRLSLAAGSGGFSSCGAELCVAVTSVGSRVRGVLVALGLSSCGVQAQLPVACGILDQGSNLCALHWQADSSPLDHQGSPR